MKTRRNLLKGAAGIATIAAISSGSSKSMATPTLTTNSLGVSVVQYLTGINGGYDATAELQQAIDENNTVFIPSGVTISIYNKILLTSGKRIIGESGISSNDTNVSKQTVIQSETDLAYIDVARDVTISGVTFIRTGAATDANGLSGFAGKAVNCPNNKQVTDVEIFSCNFFGYGIAIDMSNGSLANTRGRWYVTNINMDCDIGITMDYVLDNCYFSNIHQWPFLGNGLINNGSQAKRSKLFELGNRVDWIQIDNCFSHSTKNFISGSVGNISITNGGWDYEEYGVDTDDAVGVSLNSQNIGGQGDGTVKLSNMTFNGGKSQIRINMAYADNNNNTVSIIGCSFDRAGWAFIDVVNGRLSAVGNQFKVEPGLGLGKLSGSLPHWIGHVQNNSKVVALGNMYGSTANGTWAQAGENAVIEQANNITI